MLGYIWNGSDQRLCLRSIFDDRDSRILQTEYLRKTKNMHTIHECP